MLRKTHMMAGIATAMIMMQPNNLTELMIGTGFAAIGGVISDIDVETSMSHKDANMVIGWACVVISVIGILEMVFQLHIYRKLVSNSSMLRIIMGMGVILITCIFGKNQPHRSFMHSFLALAILTVAVGVIFPVAAPYFGLSFVSHLFLDLFNFKKVRLFYPLQGGVCLGLFHASGLANAVFFIAGSVLSVVELAILFGKCF